MREGHATDALVEFAVKTTLADLPREVRDWGARALVDTIGVAMAGRKAAGVAEARAMVEEWGGKPEATLWGTHCRVPSPHAAFVNAAAARALDFDDVFDAIPLHPSAYLVPAALAAGEATGGAPGGDLVAALAVGAEVMIRLALGRGPTDPDAARPPLSRILGPTVAAARMLGLDPMRMRHALGIAFSLAAGELQSYDDGALTIRLHQGFVAEAAIKAALLAAAGITGPWNFLEGRRGLARVDGIVDLERTVAEIGREFHAHETALKPYPCCRCSHPAISAALRLRSAHGVTPEAIAGIVVEVAPMCAAVVVEPRDVRFNPRTIVDAQFSLPYVVACALATGQVDLGSFSAERLRDSTVRRLMARLEVAVREAERGAPEGMIAPARVEVVLATGARLAMDGSATTCRADLAAGGADRKFASCMTAGGRAGRIGEALALLRGIEDEPDAISRLVALLADE